MYPIQAKRELQLDLDELEEYGHLASREVRVGQDPANELLQEFQSRFGSSY